MEKFAPCKWHYSKNPLILLYIIKHFGQNYKYGDKNGNFAFYY